MENDLTKGSGTASPPAGAAEGTFRAAGKAAVRRALSARRSSLSPEEARAKGEAAQAHLLRSPVWRSARCVALYAAVRGEIATQALLRAARDSGKTVLLPRVLPRSEAGEGQMVFASCNDEADLIAGCFGIPEPAARCPVWDQAPDLLVLPAVGLDREGGRLGYGGGYYDRFLRRKDWRKTPRIGLVFALQIVDILPCDAWDIRVDALLSEEELLWL